MKLIPKPDVQSAIDKYSPEIAQQIVSALGPQLEKAGAAINDDEKYLKFVVTPLFDLLPGLIRMIGRERLKWDPIMFAVRDQVVVVDGARITVRPNTLELVLAIVRKQFAKAEQAGS